MRVSRFKGNAMIRGEKMLEVIIVAVLSWRPKSILY
jgi:hypothetical protein